MSSLLFSEVRVSLEKSLHSLLFVKCCDPKFIQKVKCFAFNYDSTFYGNGIVLITQFVFNFANSLKHKLFNLRVN